MAIINLQRDMYWLDHASLLSWSAQSQYGQGSIEVSTDGNVYSNTAWAVADPSGDQSVTAKNVRCIGLHMLPPYNDRVPYRVKARAFSEGDAKFGLFIGRGPAEPAAGDNTISSLIAVGPADSLDEVFCLQDFDAGDPNYGTPITFGLALFQCATDKVIASMSVQRCVVQPPSYASALS